MKRINEKNTKRTTENINNVYLVFKTFATGYRVYDSIFGIAYTVFNTDGTNYGSDLLVYPLVPQAEVPLPTPTSKEEWCALWKQNGWSMMDFDNSWSEHINVLNKIQTPQSINCESTTDVLQKFYERALMLAYSKSSKPILVSVNNCWRFISERLASAYGDQELEHIGKANIIDFGSFALGISRSQDLTTFEYYEKFFRIMVREELKLNRSSIDFIHPEIKTYAEHVLYLDAYLKQNDISQIIQPTRQLLLGLILLGIVIGLLITLVF